MQKSLALILSFTTLLQVALYLPAFLLAENTLKIGVPLPLTGGLAACGEDLQNSFIAAKDFLNAKNVEFVFEDDQCDGQQSVNIANKLVALDKVSVVSGIYCNNALLPAASTYQRSKIPVITTGATTGDVTGIADQIFRIYPADHYAVEPLLKHFTAHYSRLCMLTALDSYTELIQRTVKKKFASLNPPYIIFSQETSPDNQDFRASFLRLNRNKCDAYYLNALSDDSFIVMLKQLRAYDSKTAIYAMYYPSSKIVTDALGANLEGVIYADLPTRSNIATKLGLEFIESYHKRFGEFKYAQPLGLFAFEALRLILKANELKIPIDKYLRNRKIVDGAMKEYSFDSDGAVQGIEFKLFQFKGGQTVELNSF